MTTEEGRQETEDRRQESEERKQNVQTLILAKNESIHLVTPLGVIQLDRDRKADSRSIRFTFPLVEGFKALKGDKPEVKTMPLVQNEDGHLTAQFDMVVPIRDSDGRILAFKVPEMFRLVEGKPADLSGVQEGSSEGGSNGVQPVSDVREDAGSGGLNDILAESGTYAGPREDLPEEAGKALEKV